jgi:hypothetical protein
VLFEQRLREGLHDGQVVLAFRRWKRRQVVAGHRYRTGLDMVEATAVDVVSPADIDAAQAGQAGFGSVAELIASLQGDESLTLYRIRFRRLDEPDPRDVLAASAKLGDDELAALRARLRRMDAASTRGAWTIAALEQIASRPATSSAELAAAMDWPRPDFKLHVRRLKALGLTISLEVGYRLSPRGEALLGALHAAGQPAP